MNFSPGAAESQSKPRAIIVLGASGPGTRTLASAIAAAQGVAMIEAGTDLGLVSVLASAEDRYRRDVEALSKSANMDGPASGSHALAQNPIDELVGPWTQGVDGTPVYHAADVLTDVPCLRGVPVLAERAPGTVFVNLTPDGVDFVARRRRACPDVDFVTHCLLWSQAQRAWAIAAPLLGGRAINVRQVALLEKPDQVAASLADGLGWSEAARDRLLACLGQRPGEDVSFGTKPIDFVSVGWTLAEKMLFAELCGEAMAALGSPLDVASAVRRSPLRLDEMILAGQAVMQGPSAMLAAPDASGAQTLTWSADAGNGTLVLPAMALNGRNRLNVTVGSLADSAPTALKVGVVESISRRSCATIEAVIDTERRSLSATVDSTTELVDIIFSTRPTVAGKHFGFRLFDGILNG